MYLIEPSLYDERRDPVSNYKCGVVVRLPAVILETGVRIPRWT